MSFPKKILELSFVVLSATFLYAEEAPQKVVDLGPTLAEFGTDAVIVEAVKAQNAQGMTLDAIKTKDDEWKATAGIVPYMQELIDSPCGARLAAILDTENYYEEIFVMDNQGANVAMSDKTSDYWQGDEAKFQNSFKNGEGAIFIDEVEFDESTQSYLVQISVPVKDGETVIGAITFGINVDEIE